jgi:hypothetical protein
MAKKSLSEIKSYFETGKYPTGQQFADAADSFRHKDDPVSMTEVEGLAEALNSKADASDVATAVDKATEALRKANEITTDFDALSRRVASVETSLDDIKAILEGVVTGKFVARRGTAEPYTYTVYDTLKAAFAGEQGQTALITISADYVMDSQIVMSDHFTNITIRQVGGQRTIMRGFSGEMFALQAGSLTLDGPTLRGTLNGGGAVVRITGNALFILKSGRITGNDNSAGDGGAVYVFGGTFRMDGGHITGNKSRPESSGGGIILYSNNSTSHFIMNGGEISGNVGGQWGGGGIRVDSGGVFTYNAGVISGNTTVNGGAGTQVKKEWSGLINGSGGVYEGTGTNKTYDVWPPQP